MRLSNRDWIVVGVIAVTALAVTDMRYGQALRLPNVVDGSAIQQGTQGFNPNETPKARVVRHMAMRPAGAETLNLSNPMGSVIVRGTDTSRVTIDYTIKVYGGDEAKAAEFLRGVKVETSRSGDELRVSRSAPRLPSGVRGLTVDYRVEIPKSLGLRVDNRFGALEALDVGAGADLHNSFGRTLLARATGDSTVESKYGEADVQGVKGDLQLDGAYGKVWLRDVTGSVDAKARYGAFGAERVGGSLKCTTTYGDLQAREVGGDLDIDSQYSQVRVEDLGGRAVVTSRYAAVTLIGLRQAATIASKAGRVEVGLKDGVGGFTVHADVTRGNFTESTSQTEPFVEQSRKKRSSGAEVTGKTGEGTHRVELRVEMGDLALSYDP